MSDTKRKCEHLKYEPGCAFCRDEAIATCSKSAGTRIVDCSMSWAGNGEAGYGLIATSMPARQAETIPLADHAAIVTKLEQELRYQKGLAERCGQANEMLTSIVAELTEEREEAYKVLRLKCAVHESEYKRALEQQDAFRAEADNWRESYEAQKRSTLAFQADVEAAQRQLAERDAEIERLERENDELKELQHLPAKGGKK